MITYTWVINALHTLPEPLPEFVTTALWTLVATEGEYQSDMVGSSIFEPLGSETGYIPYDELTESVLLDWVQAQLGTEQIKWMEETLATQIERLKNPPIVPVDTPLPW